MSLPSQGAVIGVDVGWSERRSSSAICRLTWDLDSIRWTIRRFRAVEPERVDTIARVAGGAPALAAALDGPLRRGLDEIGRYRVAERMLTRELAPSIGKPGQSSTPNGRQLNRHANICAHHLLAGARLEPASQARIAIHDRAICEAFPSSFLGLMLRDPVRAAATRSNRSDRFFEALVADGTLQVLLARLLPGRHLTSPLAGIRNHDDRAAFVCALTALCLARGDFTAVGDDDGWIILPPHNMVAASAWSMLEASAASTPDALFISHPDGASQIQRRETATRAPAALALLLGALVFTPMCDAQVTGKIGPCKDPVATAGMPPPVLASRERDRARQHDEAGCIREGDTALQELCRAGCDDATRETLRKGVLRDCEALWGWSCSDARHSE